MFNRYWLPQVHDEAYVVGWTCGHVDFNNIDHGCKVPQLM